ncbi:MAG: aconitate hydratase AcnA [Deltaproteobacteria bacterium]|nr:aconitate hydratase AcnA [Deltaproteobacteria bacterium]
MTTKPARLPDPFHARTSLHTPAGEVTVYRLGALEDAGLCKLSRLPYAIRILLESLLRNAGRGLVTEDDVKSLAGWRAAQPPAGEVPFMVGRVLMQDFTGVPAVVDLAAMRDAMAALGGDPNRINPLIPTDLVIDHSVQVDYYGTPDALTKNEAKEFERNRERYQFLKWGAKAFQNFRVIPPSTGIVHQVNLEYLAGVVALREEGGGRTAFPDTVIGTDSHTTMINGLGVLGWGVGGIEAEASMLGQPYYMLAPEVVGFRLEGRPGPRVTATDLVLRVTEMLRAHGVVNKFVEFTGPGLAALSLADRATLANMAPEYGATMGFFPVDAKTLDYLRLSGRDDKQIALVETVLKALGLFHHPDDPTPEYSSSLTLDMATVEPALAGPKRPQDRVVLSQAASQFQEALAAPTTKRGFGLEGAALTRTAQVRTAAGPAEIGHGAVVIAAITSCTNTSNPAVMVAAGLLAQKAAARGLKVKPWVKTSLAPGSRVVTDYLTQSGLLPHLEALGFHVVGYGCTTCIGNSGPLDDGVGQPLKDAGLVAAAVLSGNRNFEGRVNPLVKANYLASPPLVVAYALAGSLAVDLETQPLGLGTDGKPVFLADIWPTQPDIELVLTKVLSPAMFRAQYARALEGSPAWQGVKSSGGSRYAWDDSSTYIQNPPYFEGLSREPQPPPPLRDLRVLALLGDSVTTDHISPAGSIQAAGPAGQYLQAQGVTPADFNSYGSRRGNDRVMTRGTFANIRLKNLLAPGTEGGVTRHLPSGETLSIHQAALRYKSEGVGLLVLAGKEYGTGSSRDWAAKGTRLLGVRVVLAESFERIHRSNLLGMGILPLQFLEGQNAQTLGLTGEEVFSVEGDFARLPPRAEVQVSAQSPDGSTRRFAVRSRVDTRVEAGYFANGGILQTVLRQLA